MSVTTAPEPDPRRKREMLRVLRENGIGAHESL